jgi:hypothetical protein
LYPGLVVGMHDANECLERLGGLARFEAEQPMKTAIPFDAVVTKIPAERAGAGGVERGPEPFLTLAQRLPGAQ